MGDMTHGHFQAIVLNLITNDLGDHAESQDMTKEGIHQMDRAIQKAKELTDKILISLALPRGDNEKKADAI